jgi:glycosyltransferase involved in cell wall biosynthesis
MKWVADRQGYTMKLSVIIPSFNAAKTIGCQLDALANQRWSEPWEVIVADNGSEDDTVSVAKTYVGKVHELRIIDASGRKGAPYAMNLAASVARGESIAICDADDEVAPGWVAAMGNALNIHECVASRFDFAKLNPSLGKNDPIMHHPQTKGPLRLWYPPYLPFVGSCGLGVRKTLHNVIGGFDESFVVVYDAEYCVRIQLQGSKIFFAKDAMVHIRCRPDAGASFRQVRLWAEYNVLLYKRYRPQGANELYRWKNHIKNWLEILRNFPQVRTNQQKIAWFTRLGWQVGILKGSIKHMVPPVPIP